ncbi:polymorphic toxin-type HINT domain-containing protein [Longispora fulva]
MVGDLVWATDPETGDATAEPVTQLHLNNDHDLTDLQIINAAGETSIIHTMQEHPFWDATERTWVDAGKLPPGHGLTTSNRSAQYVGTVTNYTAQDWMHNPHSRRDPHVLCRCRRHARPRTQHRVRCSRRRFHRQAPW